MSRGRWLALLALAGVAFALVRGCERKDEHSAAQRTFEPDGRAQPTRDCAREPVEPPTVSMPSTIERALLGIELESWPERAAVLDARVELVRGAQRELAEAAAQALGRYEARVSVGDGLVRIQAAGFRDAERVVAVGPQGYELRVSMLRADTTLLRARSADGATLAELARGLGETPSSFVETYTSLWWSRDGSEELRALVPLRRDEQGEPLLEFVRSEMDGDAGSDLLGVLRHADARGVWLSLTVGPRSGEWSFVAASECDVSLPFALSRDEFRKPDVVWRVARVAPQTQAWLEALDSRREGREPRAVPPSGVVRFESVDPGEYLACFGVSGGGEVRRLARVRLGRDLDLGTLELHASVPLEVVVLDGQGRRLAALVQLGPFERESKRPQGYAARGVRTQSDGVARVELGGGDVVLRARVLDGADSPLAGHESAPLVLSGPPVAARVELTVREPARVGVRGARGRLALVDAQGVVVGGTAELGSAWGGYLQPGRYRALDLSLSGDLQGERVFDVGAADEIELELH
ncbi:MAG: hypothetical protein FJ298_07720 [Planctomycetes bacterium]|nr:hypothetical protein [Planctomycetota bacterium]